MAKLGRPSVARARAAVLRLLREAPRHPHDVWLAACGKAPPRPGAVPLLWVNANAAELPPGSSRCHLVRAAIDQLEAEGAVEAWKAVDKRGRHKVRWVYLLRPEDRGRVLPRCECCGAVLDARRLLALAGWPAPKGGDRE
jgi:hypothetical protein